MSLQDSSGIVLVHKNRGETLADLLMRIRHEQRLLDTVKITYAGRLDPMAEGLVPILWGQAVHQKNKWLAYKKTYRYHIMCGVATDSGDILGIPCENDYRVSDGDKKNIEQAIHHLHGTITYPFPWLSSRKVSGKPLWWWFRNALTDTIVRPFQKTIIYNHRVIDWVTYTTPDIQTKIQQSIADVSGDFRQTEIMEQWHHFFNHHPSTQWHVAIIETTLSSGGYVRSLIQEISTKTGIPMCALRIIRTAIEIE